MMERSSASDELKKVDHLVFVTLKYTRTVDIIRSAIDRMIITLNTQISDTLEKLKEQGKIGEVPSAPVMRTQLLEKLFPKNKDLKTVIDFYYKLKKMYASEYKKKEEFRKNVALVTREDEVNIETLKEYVELMKKYINCLQDLTLI